MAFENDDGGLGVAHLEIGSELVVLLEFGCVEAAEAVDGAAFESNEDDVLFVRDESDGSCTGDGRSSAVVI